MIALRRLFKEDHPKVTIYACSDHLIDTTVSAFVKAIDVSKSIAHVKSINNMFRKHLKSAAALKSVEGSLAASVPNQTRWHYSWDMCENFITNRQALVTASNDPAICKQLQKDHKAAMANLASIAFLEKIEKIKKLIEPFKTAIKKFETDECPAEQEWITLKRFLYDIGPGHFKNTSRPDFMGKFDERINYGLSPAHFAAFFLSPSCSSDDSLLLREDAVTISTNFLTAEGVPIEFLAAWGNEDYGCLQLPAPAEFIQQHKNKSLKVCWQIAALTSKSAVVKTIIPKIVLKMEGMVSSTASQERVFSTYGSTVTKSRNRIKSTKAFQLVYLRRRFAYKPSPAESAKRQ